MIDLNINNGKPQINEDIELVIQQIDMLFDTNKREVFGAPQYGTNYEEFLWNLSLSNAAIEYQVECDLAQLELFDYTPTVKATILDGTLNDIILLQIELRRNDEYYTKIYKLS